VVAHDALILAGGAARRLGGALKPQVTVRGRRLLDHVLDATEGARQVVVVAPDTVPVPDGVTRTLEDPPFGGPVAGIAAGLAALTEPAAPWVLLLACDLPGAAAAVPRLLSAAEEPDRHPADPSGGAIDAVVLRDEHGREQWLLGIYSAAALRERVAALADAGGLRDTSVRQLVRPLWRASLQAAAGEAADVDTWADRDAITP